jgi:hypothetical protein
MASGEHAVIFCSIFSVNGTAESKHRQDALISAVAAREGFEGRWTINPSKNRHECEQNPSAYWLAPMHYFWPNADSALQENRKFLVLHLP